MAEFLPRILATTREDLEARCRHRSLDELRRAAGAFDHAGRSLINAVTRPGLSIIAEYKRASPSRGDIRPDLDVAGVVASYERGGARAVSVLTEERNFKGSLADLAAARAATSLPLLRKDFIIDPYQVWEAAAAGADAVLLIVAALPGGELEALWREARAAGLETLIEVHDEAELTRLRDTLGDSGYILGINNRDLKTFVTDLDTTANLIKLVPNQEMVVSESGIQGSEDIGLLSQQGVHAVLIGETLMRSPDPGAKVRELLP